MSTIKLFREMQYENIYFRHFTNESEKLSEN